jgi:hypothetical protein
MHLPLFFLSSCFQQKTTLTLAVSRDLLRALTTSSWCAISLMFFGRLVGVLKEEVEVDFFFF